MINWLIVQLVWIILKKYVLDVGKLQTVPMDFKKLSDVLNNEVVNNTKFSTLTSKVNYLKKKLADAPNYFSSH